MNNTIDQQQNPNKSLREVPMISLRKLQVSNARLHVHKGADNQEYPTSRQLFKSSYPAGPAVRDYVPEPFVNEGPVSAFVPTGQFQPFKQEAVPSPAISISDAGELSYPAPAAKEDNTVMSTEDLLIQEARLKAAQAFEGQEHSEAYIDAIT